MEILSSPYIGALKVASQAWARKEEYPFWSKAGGCPVQDCTMYFFS